MKFKIGDRVKVLFRNGNRYGTIRSYERYDTYTIDNGFGYGYICNVVMDHDNESIYIPEEDLCLEIVMEIDEVLENDGESPVEVGYGRKCIYDGSELARFHRWVDEWSYIIKLNTVLPNDQAKKIVNRFNIDRYVNGTADVIPTHSTVALIELRDGRVKKVEPEKIQFIEFEEGKEKED